MSDPTTRGVAAVLRRADYRSYTTDRQRATPAEGYDVGAVPVHGAVFVLYVSDRRGEDREARRDAALDAWAAALTRWDVERRPSGLVVRERRTT